MTRPLCLCGCGEETPLDRRAGTFYLRYVNPAHRRKHRSALRRAAAQPKPRGEAPLCLCGCGEHTQFNTRRNAYNKYTNDAHRRRLKQQQRRAAATAQKRVTPPPLCGCGCGERCGPSPNSPTGWRTYVSRRHQWRAEYHRNKSPYAAPRPAPVPLVAVTGETGRTIRLCACGCGQPVYHRRRYVDRTHRASSSRIYRKDFVGRVPGDLTRAQIEAIMAQALTHIRYERNRQS